MGDHPETPLGKAKLPRYIDDAPGGSLMRLEGGYTEGYSRSPCRREQGPWVKWADLEAFLASPVPVEEAAPLDLEPIKARESAATKGPWRSMSAGNSTMEDGLLDHIAEVEGLQRPWEPTWVGWKAAKNHFRSFFRQRDADFIAHARQDIPALIAEIERLRASPGPVAGAVPAPPMLIHRSIAAIEGLRARLHDTHRTMAAAGAEASDCYVCGFGTEETLNALRKLTPPRSEQDETQGIQ